MNQVEISPVQGKATALTVGSDGLYRLWRAEGKEGSECRNEKTNMILRCMAGH